MRLLRRGGRPAHRPVGAGVRRGLPVCRRPHVVHVGHLNANHIPQPVAIAAAITSQAVTVAVEAIEVVVQRIDVDQSFRRQFHALGEQAKLLDAGDHRVHLLPQPLGQVHEPIPEHERK